MGVNAYICGWVSNVVRRPPETDHENGFLPQDVWVGTRNYIEIVAKQINQCYKHHIFDGAAVLIRRMIETLLIECYEKLEIEEYIKRNGDYLMLAGIIKDCFDHDRLSMLGRDAKKYLRKGKLMGDRSAHNRRYNAIKADLDSIRDDFRLCVNELIELAELRRS